MEQVSHAYFYFLIFFLIALLLSVASLKFAAFISRKFFAAQKERVSNENYAGGFFLLSSTSQYFPLRFSLIALLFVLFKVEFLLLLPWAMALRLTGIEGFCVALFFIIFWGIGYFYAYKKGVFE